MSKQYLIDEDTLHSLLVAAHTLSILESDGVDNWWGWMEGREDYLAKYASMLPWNEGKSIDDVMEEILQEDYDVDGLADDQIKAFWEEYKE